MALLTSIGIRVSLGTIVIILSGICVASVVTLNISAIVAVVAIDILISQNGERSDDSQSDKCFFHD